MTTPRLVRVTSPARQAGALRRLLRRVGAWPTLEVARAFQSLAAAPWRPAGHCWAPARLEVRSTEPPAQARPEGDFLR